MKNTLAYCIFKRVEKVFYSFVNKIPAIPCMLLLFLSASCAILPLPAVAQFIQGAAHTAVICQDQKIYTCGYNVQGQLGDGTTTSRSIPLQVGGLAGMTAVSTGAFHTLALRNDGTVWAWGSNLSAQLGDGTTINRLTPVQVPGLSGIIAISAGRDHSMALRNDGTVWVCGIGGLLGNGSFTGSNIPIRFGNLTGIIAIGAGDAHSIVLQNDGTIWVCGSNFFGQFGDGTFNSSLVPVKGPTLPGVIAISAGEGHSMALLDDGTIWTWGANWFGQLGDGTITSRNTPVQLSLTGVAAIAAGDRHSMALLNNGTVRTWGLNASGQLGDGTTTDSTVPVQVTGLGGVTTVAAGSAHSIALKNDGTVWGWGNNSLGQLGTGIMTFTETVPVQMLLPCTVTVCTLTGSITSVTGVNCSGDNDGTAAVAVASGSAPYTYFWETGGTGASDTALTGGFHHVAVIDNKGCIVIKPFAVAEPPPFILIAAATDASCNGCNDGSVNLTVSGGTPPYTFTWSNGQTTEDIGNLTAGIYTVIVNDANLCADTISATVDEPVFVPPQTGVTEEWVRRFSGPDSIFSIASAIDVNHNVYVAGSTFSFSTQEDFVLLKYTPTGDLLWARTYNGPGNGFDRAVALALDGHCSTYITGISQGTSFQFDIVTIRYDSAGTEQWVGRYDGPISGTDIPSGIAIDTGGNIYVSGYSDMGTPSGFDILTIKYGPSGQQAWARTHSGDVTNGFDFSSGIALDVSGNAYVSGSARMNNTSSVDAVLLKYDSQGNQQWVRLFDGAGLQLQDQTAGVAVADDSHIYVTGFTQQSTLNEDYLLLRYDSSGNMEWHRRYNGPANGRDMASALVAGAGGSITITGTSFAGVHPTLGVQQNELTTIQYNSAGTQRWVQRFGGPFGSFSGAAGTAGGASIATDNEGNIYAGGSAATDTTVIFFGNDPFPQCLASNTCFVQLITDYATVKYDTGGSQKWVQFYGGVPKGFDQLTDLAADEQGNVYATGLSYNGNNFDIATIRYNQQPPLFTVEDIDLGAAASFALLADADITAADTIAAVGNVGSFSGIVSGNIFTTYTLFQTGDTEVGQAIEALDNAIFVIEHIPEDSSISGNLGGQTLSEGVYDINGNALLSGTLTLTGDASSIYVFKISDTLTVDSGAVLELGNVLPQNVYWVMLSSYASIGKNAKFSGIVMTRGNIVSQGGNTGHVALLSAGGNITLFVQPGQKVSLFSQSNMIMQSGPPFLSIPSIPFLSVPVCGDTVFFSVNISSGSFADSILLDVLLPPGVGYVPGTVSNGKYPTAEHDTSNLNQPEFLVLRTIIQQCPCCQFCFNQLCYICEPYINPTDTFTVTFGVVAGCFADTGNMIVIALLFNKDGTIDTLQDTSNTFQILSPVININQSQMQPNSSIPGNVRDTICRFITISNDGNAPLFTGFTVTENYGSAIEFVSITIDSAIVIVDTVNNLITINIPADSLPPGGFMPGSKIVFEECFRIVSCTDVDSLKNLGLSAFNYSWSCDTAVCQGGSTTANILVPATNNATISVNAFFVNEDVCYGSGNSSEVSATITNSGSGPAFDFRLKLFGISSLFMAIDTGQFKLDGIPVLPDSFALGAPDFCRSPYISYAEFLMDVPPLTTRTLLFNTITCCPDTLSGCGDKHKFLPVHYSYHDQCAADTDSVSVTNAGFFDIIGELEIIPWSGPDEMLDFEFDTIPFKAEDTSEFVFRILNFKLWPCDTTDMFMMVFNLNGGLCYLDSSLVITNNNTFWLPQTVVVDIDSSTCAGTVTAFFSLNDKPDTININNAEIHIWFIAQCPAQAASIVDLSTFYVPSINCPDTCAIPLSCDKQLITFVQCPGCDRSGIFSVDADFFRKNLGLPDNDNNGVADTGTIPDTNRELLMVGDTLTGVVTSLVQNLTYPANPVFRYGYYEIKLPDTCAGSMAPVSTLVTASIYDAANDTTYNFQLKPPELFSTNEYRYDFSIDTIHQSGVPFTYDNFSHGDIITIMPEFVVTGNVGAIIQPCGGMRNHVYLGLAPFPQCDPRVCEPDTSLGGIIACNDTIPLCDSTVQYYCENAGGSFQLIGYDYAAYPGLSGVINCVQSISVSNYIRIGPYNDFSFPGNWFPFEYRNWGFNDTATVTMPPGFILDSITFTAFRSAGGIFVNQSLSRITPDTKTVDSFGDTVITVYLQQYFSSDTAFAYQNDSLVYFADDDYAAVVIIYMHPTCQTPQIINTPPTGDISTVNISYEPAFAAQFNGNTSYYFNYFPPVLNMQAFSSPQIDGVANIACWDVSVPNTGGNASNVWLASHSPSGNIQVSDMSVEIDTLIAQNGIYQLGSIDLGTDKNVKICAQYSCDFTLNTDSLVLFLGWDCPDYPDSLQSALCPPDTFKLYLNPKPAELQHSVLMPDSIFICDTIRVADTITNINAANVYDIIVTATLPAGIGYDSLSGFMQYPVTALPVPANPQLNQDTIVWNLGNYIQYINNNGIPGSGFVDIIDSSKLLLTFNLLSSCSLTPTNSIDIKVTGITNCGDTIALNFTKNLIIRDYPTPTEKTIAVGATNFSGCDSTATIDVVIVNKDTSLTGPQDIFVFTMPECVNYNNGFNGILNPPDSTPGINMNVLTWNLPDSIAEDDTIHFTFEIILTSLCSVNTFIFNGLTTSYDSTLFCAATGQNCPLDIPAAEDTAIAKLPAPLAVNFTGTNVSCNDSCDGTATVSVTGGVPPYTYFWLPSGDTTATIDSLCADTFFVFVTDSQSCTVTDSVIITEPAVLAGVITDSTDAICVGVCNGTATVAASGGTPPYTFLWDDVLSQTGAGAIGLCAGNYNVLVTDTNGCTTTDSVTIGAIDTLTSGITKTDVSCNGLCDGTATSNPLGGTPPYTFFWFDGFGFFAFTQTADSLCARNFGVSITDANDCSIDSSFTISEPPVLTASITDVKDVTCNGFTNGEATVTPTGGIPPYTYLWNDIFAQTDSTATTLFSGNYTVTVTDSNGCDTTSTVTITEPPPLSVTVAITDATCSNTADGKITITASGGTPPYTFHGGLFQSDTTLTGLLPGNYNIFISDNNSCSEFQIINLGPQPITITFAATPASSCISSDGLATANVTGGTPPYTFSWSTVPVQTTQMATGLDDITYSVTVTDANGCITSSSVAIASSFSVNTTSTPSCGAGPNGTATATPVNGTAPFAFLWNTLPIQTNQTATGLAPGAYTITVTDANPCIATASVIIQDTTTYTHQNGIVISADTTWNGVHFRINDGISITNNAKLTLINSIFEFSGNGITFAGEEQGILVGAGTQLLVLHDTLTNIRGCSEMWDGIGVVGSKVPPNGRVDMLAGSLLENAHTGIKNIRPGSDFPGIIFISNSAMKNNRRHVVIRALFAPPQSPWYSFINAEFLCTGPLVDTALYQGEGTSEFMHLDFAPKSIPIRGCTFRNTGTFTVQKRGVGIMSNNASYTVEPQGTDTTRFIALRYGIYAQVTNPFRTISIRDNVFDSTHRSILLRNINLATVTRNRFGALDNGGYGLYLDGCTGYQVEENEVYGNFKGIIANNSGNGGDEIYNNTFHDILNGIQPQGIASLNSNEGLQIKCNDFTDSIFQYHIAVTSGDIGDPQGVCDLADKSSPAGNTFTHECNFANSDIAAHSGTFFRYNHHLDTITTPLCYDTISVDPVPCPISFIPSEVCPSHLDTIGGPSDPCLCCPQVCIISIDNQQLIIDSTQSVFDALLDGGDTQAMLDTIATQSAGKIKESVLRVSPFASDAVLIAAVNKNKPLSFGIIKEIILANSPVSDTVYQSLINRQPPLPPGILSEIDAAQVGVSPRDSLEGLIRFLVRQRSIAVNNLNRLYLNDTTINGIDSVIAVLEQEQGTTRKMQLAQAYIANNDFVKARQLLDSLENVSGFENFAVINKFIIDVLEDSASFDTLMVDTTLRQTVEIIANDTLKFGYLAARAILSQVFGTIYPELIEEFPVQPQLKWSNNTQTEIQDTVLTIVKEKEKEEKTQFVKVYPNPATKTITIEYNLSEKIGIGKIVIYNLLGISKDYELAGNYGKMNIDVSAWNSGLYYYTIVVNNNAIARNKIVIIKDGKQ